MGLMYMFPVSKEEMDRIDIKENGITLKTYGLPMIFWGYLIAILVVVGAMSLAIKGPIEKLLQTGDTINIALSYAVLFVLIGLPLTLIALYFYEKLIRKNKNHIYITHRIFWIPVWKKKIELQSNDALEVNHFLDSPNVAKMNKDANMKGFENKGYFEIFATDINGKKIFLDRHSRKADMTKIRDLLIKY